MDKSKASYLLLNHERLSDTMHKVLIKKRVSEESRKHLINSVIQTSLRGVDSHGINLFPHYCRAYDSGRINSEPNLQTEKVSTSAIKVNADYAVGHHAGAFAMDSTIELAKETGIACAGVYNSNHFGAAAYFGLRAAEKNCIGLAFTNGDALVKAFRSKIFYFGTNPICFTAPLRDEAPFCLDMATSLVSYNKIKNYRRSGEEIPIHWAYDQDGNSVSDPNKAVSLSPIGDYKGFGLGMMIEILSAILMNSVTGKDMLPMFTSPIEAKRYVAHFFVVLDISKFLHLETFKESLQNMVNDIRQLPRIDKNIPVQVPGDPEKKTLILREKKGIPILKSHFKEFVNIYSEFEKSIISE